MYLILLHKAIQKNANRFLAKALQEFFFPFKNTTIAKSHIHNFLFPRSLLILL